MARNDTSVDYLLNEIQKRLNLRFKTEVGYITGLTCPVASRARHNVRCISPEVILRIHETSGIPVAQIRSILKAPAQYDVYPSTVAP